MSTNYALKASKREGTGKGAARALRREGRVPAVIYGDNKEPVTIALDANELKKQYMKGHLFTTVCDLDLEGSGQRVLARDAQLHPVTDVVEHVDFLRVTRKTRIPVNVPVTFTNEAAAPGLASGILSVLRHEVEVFCSALEIPETIEVDLSGLDIGESVKSDAVSLPEGVEFTISDRDFTIATILAPKKAVSEEPEEGAEATAEGGEEASE